MQDHVDQWLDKIVIEEEDKNISYVKLFLEIYRLPAWKQTSYEQFFDKVISCQYQGEQYRLVGCSRLGDIFLSKNLIKSSSGYSIRVGISECTNWSVEGLTNKVEEVLIDTPRENQRKLIVARNWITETKALLVIYGSCSPFLSLKLLSQSQFLETQHSSLSKPNEVNKKMSNEEHTILLKWLKGYRLRENLFLHAPTEYSSYEDYKEKYWTFNHWFSKLESDLHLLVIEIETNKEGRLFTEELVHCGARAVRIGTDLREKKANILNLRMESQGALSKIEETLETSRLSRYWKI